MLAPCPRCATTARSGSFAKVRRQHARDVLVGQPVKAVADDPLVGERARQGEAARDVGLGPMKRGVEARDLRQVRTGFPERPDGCEVVRLMKRRERRQGLQLGEDLRIDQDRLGVTPPAVHDPVPGRLHPQLRKPLVQTAGDRVQGTCVVRRRDRLAVNRRNPFTLDDKPRLAADGVHLAATDPPPGCPSEPMPKMANFRLDEPALRTRTTSLTGRPQAAGRGGRARRTPCGAAPRRRASSE